MRGKSSRFLIIMFLCCIILSTVGHVEVPYTLASGSTHSTESINITTENTDAKYDRQKLLHQCITLNFLDSNTFVIAFDTVEVYTGRYISTNQEQVDINAFNILIDGLESSFLAESNNTLLNIFK